MAFKGEVASGLTLLLILPFRRSPLTTDPDFYGQSALLWLGAMTLAAAAVELSFSFYFLWALFWAAVLVVSPWKGVKFVSLVVGPLWLFWAAYEVFGPHPDLELSRWALASPVAGNFILTMLIFPFLLQVNAWHLSGRRHQERNESLRAAVQLSLWGLGALVLGLVVLRIGPFQPPPSPPAVQRFDLAQKKMLPAGLWQIQVDKSAFLNRSVWTIRFLGSLHPEILDLTLVSSAGPLTIFDCSFPAVLDAQGQTASIVVGRQPPLPLVLRLTLPADTKATLQIQASSKSQNLELSDSVDLKP